LPIKHHYVLAFEQLFIPILDQFEPELLYKSFKRKKLLFLIGMSIMETGHRKFLRTERMFYTSASIGMEKSTTQESTFILEKNMEVRFKLEMVKEKVSM
jgi:hypothetical protein